MKKYLIGMIAVIVVVGVAGVASVGAATNIGNGANSWNKAKEITNTQTQVGQYNYASQFNDVGVNQNSGGNKANKNTGGNIYLGSTGDATVEVGIENNANSNSAAVLGCGCQAGSYASNVQNGADSHNKAIVKNNNSTIVNQSNVAYQSNIVSSNQNTGNNSANKNTNGNVNVTSGNASTTVAISNNANVNQAIVGSGL